MESFSDLDWLGGIEPATGRKKTLRLLRNNHSYAIPGNELVLFQAKSRIMPTDGNNLRG